MDLSDENDEKLGTNSVESVLSTYIIEHQSKHLSKTIEDECNKE